MSKTARHRTPLRCYACELPLHERRTSARCSQCKSPYHLECLESRGGCANSRCARYDDDREPPISSTKARRLVYGTLVPAWLLVWLVGPLALMPFALSVAFLAYRRAGGRALASLIGFSPFFVLPAGAFAFATLTYWAGCASVPGGGSLGWRRGLHPDARCPQSPRGCVVLPHQAFTELPHTAGVIAWGKLCGPMPRAYRGPLPTLEEALAHLRTGRWTTLAELQDQPELSGLADALEQEAHRFADRDLRVARVGDECLLVSDRSYVAAFDLQRGRRVLSHFSREHEPFLSAEYEARRLETQPREAREEVRARRAD